MKFCIILAIAGLGNISFADSYLSETGSSVESFVSELPTTVVVKDGKVVGTLETEITSDEEAALITEAAEFPSEMEVADEKENELLSSSSTNSYYYYHRYGAYYNYQSRGYGYHYGRHHYRYNNYYRWGGYSYYRYSYRYSSYRHRGHHRYYWW